MSPKQRENLAGQVVAACTILREVMIELAGTDATKKTYENARKACNSARTLLRSVSYESIEQ